MNSTFSLGSNPKTAHYICTNNLNPEKKSPSLKQLWSQVVLIRGSSACACHLPLMLSLVLSAVCFLGTRCSSGGRGKRMDDKSKPILDCKETDEIGERRRVAEDLQRRECLRKCCCFSRHRDLGGTPWVERTASERQLSL